MKRLPMLAATALVIGLANGNARADELVQVAPHRATPPAQRGETTPPLLGFLTRPYGPGRFPAVVLLHWCSGFGAHDTTAAATLKSWGFVALALDSLGDANMCQGGGGSMAEVVDAYAALRFLAARDFVASDRIAVMGYSMGGLATLAAVDRSPLAEGQPARFRAAIAYYPPCQFITGDLTAPALILIGEHDDWSSPDACRKLLTHENDIGITRGPGTGATIDLIVYPDATHAFDSDLPPHRYLGHFMRYDPAATQDAATKVHAFLRDKIGDLPEMP
jgi:dienelactone hydrolase